MPSLTTVVEAAEIGKEKLEWERIAESVRLRVSVHPFLREVKVATTPPPTFAPHEPS